MKLANDEWFEYTLPFTINTSKLQWIQPSIEAKGISVVCLISQFLILYYKIIIYIPNILKWVDYIRFTPSKQYSTLILTHGLPNIPEAFEERYFPKKEMENLLELKDIISNL